MIENIETVADLVKFSDELRHSSFIDTLWWRGQADKNWRLIPSVFREGGSINFENGVFQMFKQKAYAIYPHCPPNDDTAGYS